MAHGILAMVAWARTWEWQADMGGATLALAGVGMDMTDPLEEEAMTAETPHDRTTEEPRCQVAGTLAMSVLPTVPMATPAMHSPL